MSEKVDLSIVIVTYNHAATIEKCILSCLQQKTDYSFEIIIADDSSVDGTRDVIMAYQEQYPGIIKPIFRKNNVGPSQNFSGALQQAGGGYIAYCDGDDYWCNENKIQLAMTVLTNHPELSIFIHNTLVKDKEKEQSYPFIRPMWRYLTLHNKLYFYLCPSAHISSWVYKKITFSSVRDVVMYYQILSSGPAYYHDEIMSVYNYSGSGLYSSMNKKEKDKQKFIYCYITSKEMNFKHDIFFSLRYRIPLISYIYKALFGIEKGWKRFLERMNVDSQEIR